MHMLLLGYCIQRYNFLNNLDIAELQVNILQIILTWTQCFDNVQVHTNLGSRATSMYISIVMEIH